MKIRTSVNIDKRVLIGLDAVQKAKSDIYRNRSHIIECALRFFLKKQKETK